MNSDDDQLFLLLLFSEFQNDSQNKSSQKMLDKKEILIFQYLNIQRSLHLLKNEKILCFKNKNNISE